jgi:putative ABC transport system substrate-binding protein
LKRRAALAGLLAFGAAVPPLALAQKSAREYRVGIFSIGTDPARPVAWHPLVDTLHKHGYAEGKNLVLIRAHGGGNFDLVEPLLQDLLAQRPDVIVLSGLREVHAARKKTTTIPIVMTQMPSDPVAEGLVESLARPGGNVTGFMFLIPGIYQKYVELITESVPSATRIATITSPPHPSPLVREELQAAAKIRRVHLTIAQVKDPAEIEPTLARLKKEGVGAMVAPLDGFTIRYRQELARAAANVKLPVIYSTRTHVDAGGLMSYGTSIPDLMRRGAEYVDRILKGAKPAELPVQQPTRFELVLNLKAATALGITFPPTIMVRAEEVIR